MRKNSENIQIKVTAKMAGLGAEEKWPEMAVYLFNRFGELAAKKPLTKKGKENGEAVFDFEGKSEQLLVKLGPDLHERELHKLERRKPFKEKVTAILGEENKLVLEVPEPFWKYWFMVPYIVKGNVLGSLNGENVPVCYGKVEIYDVDPTYWCILKLPDPVIERVRDAIIDVIVDPPPVRIPEDIQLFQPWPDDDDGWCGTTPRPPHPPFELRKDAGTLEEMKEEGGVLKALEELPVEWQFSRERFKKLGGARERISVQLEMSEGLDRYSFLNQEPIEGVKISEILHADTGQFKNLLLDKFELFRPWLCWWPWIYWLWWPWCHGYKQDLLGTAEIKPDGSFCKTVWIPAFSQDTPDLWFKVKQKIYGVESTVYAKEPVPCHTYWNHPNNTSVTLTVTDPDAFVCHPDPTSGLDHGNPWVVFAAVGNYSLKKIYGTGAGNAPDKIGLYSSIETRFNDGPFGGTLQFRLLFSRALEKMTKPVKFYRIKYRVNGGGNWIPLVHDVVRHYSHFKQSNKSLEFLAYQLGPRIVGNENALFEIPPADTPNKTSEPEADWYVTNAHIDLPNGYLSTAAINGSIEIKMELFDKNGRRINPATHGGGIPIYIPANNDIWKKITMANPATVNPNLFVNDPEDPSFKVFMFKLVVENRPAYASISEPQVMPSGGDVGDCGFIRYHALNSFPVGLPDTSLTLPFIARQHRKFAIYRFSVERKISQKFLQTGLTGDMGSNGLFEPNVSLATILAGCARGEGAFSENLYIWHKAFNGWSRLRHLDANYVRAFALTPIPPLKLKT